MWFVGRRLLIIAHIAALAAVWACSDRQSTEPATPFRPGLTIGYGDLVSGRVTRELPNELGVQLRNAAGQTVAGAIVSFRVSAGGGNVSPTEATTDRHGFARVRWTLGPVIGDTQRVEARAVLDTTAGGVFVAIFRATGMPDVPGITNAHDYLTADERVWVRTKSYPSGAHVTAGLQTALDANKIVWLSEGEYRISGRLTINDGQVLVGDGADKTALRQYGQPLHQQGLLFIDSGSPQAQRSGIRVIDLMLDGRSDVLGFSPPRHWQHLVAFSGVRDVVFDGVAFRASRMAGVTLTTGPEERHNANVIFRRCTWDGVDHSNWMAIHIGDCDGCVIDSPVISNWQLRSREPGVIVVEPPARSRWAVLRNIHVRGGRLANNGGSASHGAINFVFSADLTTAATNFSVVGTEIRSSTGSGIQFNHQGSPIRAGSLIPRHDLVVSNVSMSGIGRPFLVYGLHGGRIDSVIVEHATGPSYIGANGKGSDDDAAPGGPKYNVVDLAITRSVFRDCANGGSQDAAFRIHGVNGFLFEDNEVDRCGDAGASTAAALKFFGKDASEPPPRTITSDRVRIIGNRFIGGGRMSAAIGRHPDHLFTAANNEERNNAFGGLVNQFQAMR